MVERKKQIEIEEQEIKRKEKELTATVKLPSEAEAYKVQTVAEGNRTRVVESAKADGEKIRLIGGAEARAVEAVGRAEAESMRLKASAYKQYGDAAVMSLVLEALPSIAAEVAAPLAKTDEIVLIGGGNNTTNEINKLVGTLPPAIQVNNLLIYDFREALKKFYICHPITSGGDHVGGMLKAALILAYFYILHNAFSRLLLVWTSQEQSERFPELQ